MIILFPQWQVLFPSFLAVFPQSWSEDAGLLQGFWGICALVPELLDSVKGVWITTIEGPSGR